MPIRTALLLLLAVALAATAADRADLLARIGLGGSGPGGGVGGQTAQVTRVVDGDTIHVDLGGRDVTVRYIGMDTPETVKPDTPVQCYGKAASDENKHLVTDARVRLVPDAEAKDKYGRSLFYVYRASDGLFVNEALVKGGYARTLTIPPNDHFAARFAADASRARADGTGLWGACGG